MASHYYITVLRRQGLGERAVQRHIKMTMVIETRCQIVIAVRFRYWPDSDFGDAIPALERAAEAREIAVVVGDKGNDSKEIRRFIWYHLGAQAHIPLRRENKNSGGLRNVYRGKQEAESDAAKYRLRALSETVNSVLKRTMRGDVMARGEEQQHKELLLRAITSNMNREADLMNDFY